MIRFDHYLAERSSGWYGWQISDGIYVGEREKILKYISLILLIVFQGNFKEFLFCCWQSSQLPEQNKGLLFYKGKKMAHYQLFDLLASSKFNFYLWINSLCDQVVVLDQDIVARISHSVSKSIPTWGHPSSSSVVPCSFQSWHRLVLHILLKSYLKAKV